MCFQMCTYVPSERRVHLTSGSITSSQRMLTEINDSGAIAKKSISVESDTIKHLKAFTIISSQMSISRLILS